MLKEWFDDKMKESMYNSDLHAVANIYLIYRGCNLIWKCDGNSDWTDITDDAVNKSDGELTYVNGIFLCLSRNSKWIKKLVNKDKNRELREMIMFNEYDGIEDVSVEDETWIIEYAFDTTSYGLSYHSIPVKIYNITLRSKLLRDFYVQKQVLKDLGIKIQLKHWMRENSRYFTNVQSGVPDVS